MCGIAAFYGSEPEGFVDEGSKIQYRGPDITKYTRVDSNLDPSRSAGMLFHRLAIVGLDNSGDQPLVNDGVYLICNGEIYNHSEIMKEEGFWADTTSDCEVILHLYKKYGLERCLERLDGVFAFFLYDSYTDTAYAARDRFGVRPAFYGINKGTLFVASEAKAIESYVAEVRHLTPGHYIDSTSLSETEWYNFPAYPVMAFSKSGKEDVTREIRWRLVKAVEKRMMSDREVCCLLSGGLDSSLVASIVSMMTRGYRLVRTTERDSWQHFPDKVSDYKLKTFSIGMAGSPDLEYADIAARWIDSDHHRIELTEDDFLESIERTIYVTESYDTTTIRASVGNYLVSKYIADNTDCKVVFNGDGSDEVCCGYVYNANAPNPIELQNEAKRLVDEIYLFDVLRSDRSISSNGLEPRTPFLDKDFVEYYFSIHPAHKLFGKNDKMEKELLRSAFQIDGLLPREILWRHKCAFSDGVSAKEKSWHKTLQAHIESVIADDEFEKVRVEIKNCTPELKESLYYRRIHRELFSESMDNLIPHFWMPRWTDVKDPSARELDTHKE